MPSNCPQIIWRLFFSKGCVFETSISHYEGRRFLGVIPQTRGKLWQAWVYRPERKIIYRRPDLEVTERGYEETGVYLRGAVIAGNI